MNVTKFVRCFLIIALFVAGIAQGADPEQTIQPRNLRGSRRAAMIPKRLASANEENESDADEGQKPAPKKRMIKKADRTLEQPQTKHRRNQGKRKKKQAKRAAKKHKKQAAQEAATTTTAAEEDASTADDAETPETQKAHTPAPEDKDAPDTLDTADEPQVTDSGSRPWPHYQQREKDRIKQNWRDKKALKGDKHGKKETKSAATHGKKGKQKKDDKHKKHDKKRGKKHKDRNKKAQAAADAAAQAQLDAENAQQAAAEKAAEDAKNAAAKATQIAEAREKEAAAQAEQKQVEAERLKTEAAAAAAKKAQEEADRAAKAAAEKAAAEQEAIRHEASTTLEGAKSTLAQAQAIEDLENNTEVQDDLNSAQTIIEEAESLEADDAQEFLDKAQEAKVAAQSALDTATQVAADQKAEQEEREEEERRQEEERQQLEEQEREDRENAATTIQAAFRKRQERQKQHARENINDAQVLLNQAKAVIEKDEDSTAAIAEAQKALDQANVATLKPADALSKSRVAILRAQKALNEANGAQKSAEVEAERRQKAAEAAALLAEQQRKDAENRAKAEKEAVAKKAAEEKAEKAKAAAEAAQKKKDAEVIKKANIQLNVARSALAQAKAFTGLEANTTVQEAFTTTQKTIDEAAASQATLPAFRYLIATNNAMGAAKTALEAALKAYEKAEAEEKAAQEEQRKKDEEALLAAEATAAQAAQEAKASAALKAVFAKRQERQKQHAKENIADAEVLYKQAQAVKEVNEESINAMSQALSDLDAARAAQAEPARALSLSRTAILSAQKALNVANAAQRAAQEVAERKQRDAAQAAAMAEQKKKEAEAREKAALEEAAKKAAQEALEKAKAAAEQAQRANNEQLRAYGMKKLDGSRTLLAQAKAFTGLDSDTTVQTALNEAQQAIDAAVAADTANSGKPDYVLRFGTATQNAERSAKHALATAREAYEKAEAAQRATQEAQQKKDEEERLAAQAAADAAADAEQTKTPEETAGTQVKTPTGVTRAGGAKGRKLPTRKPRKGKDSKTPEKEADETTQQAETAFNEFTQVKNDFDSYLNGLSQKLGKHESAEKTVNDAYARASKKFDKVKKSSNTDKNKKYLKDIQESLQTAKNAIQQAKKPAFGGQSMFGGGQPGKVQLPGMGGGAGGLKPAHRPADKPATSGGDTAESFIENLNSFISSVRLPSDEVLAKIAGNALLRRNLYFKLMDQEDAPNIRTWATKFKEWNDDKQTFKLPQAETLLKLINEKAGN
ncbi:hypothetical protein K2X40_02165 [Candidatus Babeliales bacterium]|nr:hypothetical protein [Candidatus Babeliales bacterium]